MCLRIALKTNAAIRGWTSLDDIDYHVLPPNAAYAEFVCGEGFHKRHIYETLCAWLERERDAGLVQVRLETLAEYNLIHLIYPDTSSAWTVKEQDRGPDDPLGPDDHLTKITLSNLGSLASPAAVDLRDAEDQLRTVLPTAIGYTANCSDRQWGARWNTRFLQSLHSLDTGDYTSGSPDFNYLQGLVRRVFMCANTLDGIFYPKGSFYEQRSDSAPEKVRFLNIAKSLGLAVGNAFVYATNSLDFMT